MEQQQQEQPVIKDGFVQSSGENRRILDSMNIEAMSFLLDGDLTLHWTSTPFCLRTGYPAGEFLSRFGSLRCYYAGYPDEFLYIQDRLMEAAKQEETEVELLSPIPRREGDTEWGLMRATFGEAAPDGQRECRVFYKEIGGDLRQKAEEEMQLKKMAGYFKWLLDEYSGNAYVADMDTYELLFLNRTSCQSVQLPLERTLGRKCYEVIQNRTSPCPFCNNSRLTEDTFYEWDFDNPFLKRTYMLKDRIIYWEGRRARLELSIDNLSTEYKLEKMDREREAMLRTIPGGFARVDARDGKGVIWYGGDFLDIIGYTKEQFEKELQFQCSYIHPDDMARVAEIMENARKTGDPTASEARIITRDGRLKVLTITFTYVSGENSWDGVESFYSVGIDITREREQQEQQRAALEEAYQSARVANNAKTNFLSSMSHDIRTPMNAIMGMTAIAQANLESPEKMQDCLNKINTSSRHLLSLINEVLDMSRIESGKISFAAEIVSLPDMVKELRDMCRPLLNEKNLQFRTSVNRLRHGHVITDGDRLRQVLMNLLSNAIKYTPEGGKIVLKINERYSQVPDKRQYDFICTDNGIGIAKDFLPHIFDPFSRAEDSRISKIQGTGLGMAITENIVRMMNGTIDVKSEEGAGSTFTVSVPLEVCGKEDARRGKVSDDTETGADGNGNDWENDPALPQEGGIKDKESLSGKKVLLVEDNDINREIVEELLQMQGIHVVSAGDGRQAKEVFEASDPGEYSLILMDIQMPVMNGYDAAAAIRRLSRKDAQTIPIVALTANAFTADAAKALNAGMNDHLAKPIEIERLLEVLLKWIG